jgi:hypothetical protein
MTETTKIVTKTVLATSLLGIAFVAGLFTFFPSIKAELVHLLEQKTQVAGRDTPVIIRGGSIVARAGSDGTPIVWMPNADPSKGYFANVGVSSKNEIFVHGEDLYDSSTDVTGLPWLVLITSRNSNGQGVDDEDKGGFKLCSEPDCNIKTRDMNDVNVYLSLINSITDSFGPSEIDDDGTSTVPNSFHLRKYGNGIDPNICKKCEHISKIIVKAKKQPKQVFNCQNGACEVSLVSP